MQININSKSGFQTGDNFIRVFDCDGKPFYFKDSINKLTNFNLPPGRYVTTNTILSSSVRSYKLPPLPRKERAGKIPYSGSIKIIYGSNPNKASIFRDKKIIVLDWSIQNLTRPEQTHIIMHELAHYIYSTESNCDLWAARQMLIAGYNPSQIFKSVVNELSNSDSAIKRKQLMLTACEKSF